MTGHRKFSELRDLLDKVPGSEERRAKARADLEREIAVYDATVKVLHDAEAHVDDELDGRLGGG